MSHAAVGQRSAHRPQCTHTFSSLTMSRAVCGSGSETYDHWEMRVHKRLIDKKDFAGDIGGIPLLKYESVVEGEVPVGLTMYNSNIESLKRKGAPIDFVPVEPVV